jgi:hypothetical protein
MSRNLKIWMWIQNNHLIKAISNMDTGTLTIYDENDNVLVKRTGLSRQQIKKIEIVFSHFSAKKLDKNQEPCTYL